MNINNLQKFVETYQSISDPADKNVFILTYQKINMAKKKENYSELIDTISQHQLPSLLYEKILSSMNDNVALSTQEKNALFSEVRAKISASSDNTHILLQKKLAIIERIESYINARTEETTTLLGDIKRKIKTASMGFFNTQGNEEVTRQKINDAKDLKKAILACEDGPGLKTAIETSIGHNEIFSKKHRKGDYGKCLDECKTLADQTPSRSVQLRA